MMYVKTDDESILSYGEKVQRRHTAFMLLDLSTVVSGIGISRAKKKPRLLLTTRLIFICTTYSGQSIKAFSGIFNTFCGNGIVHPLTLFTTVDDSAVKKDFHMVGKRRLCNVQRFQKFAGTFFAVC